MLTHAITRGDGQQGDLITKNARAIKNIPLSLKQDVSGPRELEIRGEIIIDKIDFIKLNELMLSCDKKNIFQSKKCCRRIFKAVRLKHCRATTIKNDSLWSRLYETIFK